MWQCLPCKEPCIRDVVATAVRAGLRLPSFDSVKIKLPKSVRRQG